MWESLVLTSQPISIIAAKIPVLNPGLGEEVFPLSMKIAGKINKILVKTCEGLLHEH